MSKTFHVGHENYISNEQILCVLEPNSVTAKKHIALAKEGDKQFDFSSNKKIQCVIVTRDGFVFQSSHTPKVITNRLDKSIYGTPDI